MTNSTTLSSFSEASDQCTRYYRNMVSMNEDGNAADIHSSHSPRASTSSRRTIVESTTLRGRYEVTSVNYVSLMGSVVRWY